MLLILSTAYPYAAAVSVFSTNESTVQSLASSVVAGSAPHYSWYYYCDPWNYSWCYPYYRSYWYYPYHYVYYYPYYYGYYYPTTAADPKKTITFDLNADTNPPGITPVSGKGTYNQGSIASFSLTSLILSVSANERYVFSYWSGDFSGSAPSGTIMMDSAKTVIANYQLQNYLKVSVEPPGIAPAVGEGWYPSGDSVEVGAVPSSVSGGEGTRYVFQHWTIDSVPASGNPVQVTMDGPHTVVGLYKTQYLLTVTSDYGTVQGQGWYDAGSSATFSVTSQVDTSYGVKQVFERWSGDSVSTSSTATITMDSPRTVTAVWKTDSAILYATIALGIGGAFALGIGLAAIAITRLPRAKPAPTPPLRPVATVEAAPEKLKTPPTKKKAKPPPKSDSSEASSQA
jgi:hypothetical protein